MIVSLLASVAVAVIVLMVWNAPQPVVRMPMPAPVLDVPAMTEYDMAVLAIRPDILRDIEETR